MGIARVKVRPKVQTMVEVERADGRLPWEQFNHVPIVFRLNLCKRFYISGPHTLHPGYRQRVIRIGPVSDLNVVRAFDLPACLTRIVPSAPVKVDELDPATCVEKNVGLSQITKDVSLIVQLGQNVLDLPTSILWWFALIDVIHNNHVHDIQAKARRGAFSGSGRIIGEPGLP